ncbi:MAG: hypothetical protein AB1778_06595 [Candidatus Bipolaricaulota bacterium]
MLVEAAAVQQAQRIVRALENSVRVSMGIPKIGQGWVSETELFRRLREAFPETRVIQHGKPEWLRGQHLDVYLPELRVAVEYHGLQHDMPVDHFGGEAGHEATRLRDAKKTRVCQANGCRLIIVREGYDVAALCDEIRQAGQA